MKLITLESSLSEQGLAKPSSPFLGLRFTEGEMVVNVGSSGLPALETTVKLWSHTVYELEHLSLGLRLIATGDMPKYIDVPSEAILIGPTVSLWPALRLQIGHPGIGKVGLGTTLYCSAREMRRLGHRLIDLDALNVGGFAHGTFQVDQVLPFSEALLEHAKTLAKIYVAEG